MKFNRETEQAGDQTGESHASKENDCICATNEIIVKQAVVD